MDKERLNSSMSSSKHTEIAQAAVRLFEQKGYRATSVQDIADAVGLQKGSLYHYIHSKEDLLMQIAHQAISEFNRTLEKINHENISPQKKLAKMIENHLTISAVNREAITVLLRDAFALEETQHRTIIELTDKYTDLVTSILQEGQQKGEFSVKHPKISALAILGACNWLYRWYQTDGSLTVQQISQIFADLFLNGLLSN